MSKPTVFQKLSSALGTTSVSKPQSNRYLINNDNLIKTQSKSEYDSAKLQAQQNKYLRGVWKKVDGELFQQTLHYETTRIGSYTDFESMEFYPEIAAALDVMMEESTTVNEKGKILNIYSDSSRIKGVLEDLFFNRLDIHVSLPMWTRNVCKYGDNFVLLNIDDKSGVIGARQLPNFEIERREGDVLENMIMGTNRFNTENVNDESPSKVKFFWRGRDAIFNSWQIAHFRLLGDDRRLPYGTSVLEKSRRIWKQLLMSEDAMLVYRITRAPERRVYKIFVGNIDDEDVPAYVEEIANRFKRTPIIDPQTGQVDLRYNTMANDQDFFIPVRSEDAPNPIDTLPGACIALDTRIPLLDGRILELQEIIQEWDDGNRDLWVYSCDPNTGALAPGMVTWAGETRKNADVIKITLDNGESITTTPDHKWVHRTKGFVEAKDLNVGDSLMPFYRDEKKIKSNTNEYERVWDSSKQEWVFTHRMVTEFMSSIGMEQYHVFEGSYDKDKMNTIHHMDNNRFNNNPNKEKIIKLRGEAITQAKSTNEFKESFSKIAKSNWESNEYRGKVFSKKQTLTFTDELYNMFFEMFKLYGKLDLTLNELNQSPYFMNEFISSNKNIRTSLTNLNQFTPKHADKMFKERGFKNYREWCKVIAEQLGYKNVRAWRYYIEKNKLSVEEANYNHKISNIEWLDDKQNTGTITVDGNELYHNYHTFATESGVFIKNSNLDQIADIQYLQRKLFTALRVPKSFLNFDESVGEGKNLALQDVRFSRTINRIQQAMLAELNKIAIIHLYLLGFEDDLDNFTLTLNNPSTQAEMLMIEQLQAKVTLFKDAVSDSGNGFAPMSMTRAHREILNWSDDEIKQDLLEQRMEKAAAAELENTSKVIKHTGTFDKVDSIYGDLEVAKSGGQEDDEDGESGDEGGPIGGGGFGGGALDFDDEGGDDFADEGGEFGDEEIGGEEVVDDVEMTDESRKEKKPLITEQFNKLVGSVTKKNKDVILNERVKVYDKSLRINEDINNIIKDIDNIIND